LVDSGWRVIVTESYQKATVRAGTMSHMSG
jgi:hypothetical protein